MDRLCRALDRVQNLANLLRAHAELGNYLPPRLIGAWATELDGIAADLGACVTDPGVIVEGPGHA